MENQNGNEPEVKDVEVSYIKPSDDDENVTVSNETEQTDPDSSLEENNTETEEVKKPSTEVGDQTPEGKTANTEEKDGLSEVPGETPKERALRLEVSRLKGKLRKDRTDEIIGSDKKPNSATIQKTELDDLDKSIIDKYPAKEISALREVFPVIAKEMGFVRKDEIAGTNYDDIAQNQLDSFLEKHPEYSTENDTEGTLWGAFKNEYSLYNKPANPKDFGKIFERVHREVFGIKPSGALTKVNAAREKVQVASHASSAQTAHPSLREHKSSTPGLRLDMLKGFEQDEIDEMVG